MLAVGLAGCGAVVEALYAKTLMGRDAYRVTHVCDLDPARAAWAARRFRAEVVELDALADRCDAVIVTTPPSSHASVVEASLRPGGLVLCEKPFMTSAAEARAAVAAARDAGARLYVGHFRRRFPQVELARRLVALGLIGDVTAISASEGGRFRWEPVSGYTTRERAGGVLWDTGSHTLDMALFAAALDREAEPEVSGARVTRDRDEPSHDLAADFSLELAGRSVGAHLHVSRRDALPNLLRITGAGGSVAFTAGLDDRVRLTTPRGSEVLVAERSHVDQLECFDLQLRSVLLGEGAGTFAAERFLGQVAILEALADA